MSNTETTNTIETLPAAELATVSGGAGDDKVGYNGQDVANAAQGAATGSRFGVPGAIIGGGLGFMRRNAGNLVDAGRDYLRERQRGAELDRQREKLQQKP